MSKVNPKNEVLRDAWIEELEREDAASTIDHKLAALTIYEEATDYLDFDKITVEAVDQFIEAVVQRPTRSRTNVSAVNSVKSFFEWMVMDERLKGKKARKPIKALHLKRKDRTAARAVKSRPIATISQITETIQAMPKTNAIERRNRALMAFTLLSGARDGAIISMRIKHVDFERKEVLQDPNEVDTKASKQIRTWFFPVGKFIIDEVENYISFLKTEMSIEPNDYLFPSTAMALDSKGLLTIPTITKKRWSTAQPMRKIFKSAFKSNDLPYFNPHSFRNTLMQYAYELGLEGEALKAWSQNLGHENLNTSYNSYGRVSADRQRARILGLHEKTEDNAMPKSKEELVALIREAVSSSQIST